MDGNKVSIAGLDKAEVLAALYNAAWAQGMGFLHYEPKPMDAAEASDLLANAGDKPYFDYLKGRVMKVALGGDEINPGLYDRDNGQGACAAVINRLRRLKDVNPEESELQHLENTRDAAQSASDMLGTPTQAKQRDGIFVVGLGLADVAGDLKPNLDRVLSDDAE